MVLTAPALRPPPPNDGGLGSEQAALEALLARLIPSLVPLKILLFGSRAEGRARPDSDFDLLVVLADDTPEEQIDYNAVYAPVVGLGIGCDVIPCRWSDYQAILQDPSDPWRATWSRGRTLYERR